MNKLGVDPCSLPTDQHNSLITCYVKSLIAGVSIRNKDAIRSETVKGYANEVNKLHYLRDLPLPISKASDPGILIKNLKDEETIARRRRPLTNEMAAEIIKIGEESDPLAFEALAGDIVKMARQIGPRAAEFAQTTSKKPDHHKYPSGRKVIKALCTNNIKCYTKKGKLVCDPVQNRGQVEDISVTWTIQKNRKNGEIKWYTRDRTNPKTCTVDAIINMIERAQLLDQPNDLPFGVYKDKKGVKKYVTGNVMTRYIRKIAKKLYPHMTEDDLSYFSCHSFRVWACVLLSEAGKNGDYIRIRLRWASESYRIYLRDTLNSAAQHNETLGDNAGNIIFKLDEMHLPEEDDELQEDETMGNFIDIE